MTFTPENGPSIMSAWRWTDSLRTGRIRCRKKRNAATNVISSLALPPPMEEASPSFSLALRRCGAFFASLPLLGEGSGHATPRGGGVRGLTGFELAMAAREAIGSKGMGDLVHGRGQSILVHVW